MLVMWLKPVIFYIFAIGCVGSAIVVVCSRNTMHSVLSLVVCFVFAAGLWLLLQVEFLALMLIFVYVGAVMTLFLFVVMMLQLDESKESLAANRRYFPYALLLMLLFFAGLCYVFVPSHLPWAHLSAPSYSAKYSNTSQLGHLIYTHYVLAFELAGIILLAAMVAAISLAFYGRKANTKAQRIEQQLAANKQQRLRLVDLPSETRGET